MRYLTWLLIATVILIAGCTGTVEAPGPAAAEPTNTSPAVSPTAAPDTPTPTPKPTAAPTAEPTVVPTAEPTAEAEPDIAATVTALQTPRTLDTYLSPDGQLQAEILIYDCIQTANGEEYSYEQLNLIGVNNDETTTAVEQLISCGGLGAFGLEGLYWSANSQFFYYTDAREGFPDGCGFWAKPVNRLAINDLAIERLGAGPVSPDGTKLATWQGQDIVVWDLDEGEIGRATATVPDLGAGPLTWSPDGQSIVYIQVASYCPLSGTSHVVRLDLPDLEATVLLESEEPTFGGAAWDDAAALTLFAGDGQAWRYDFATHELELLP